jgi:hypothetical protein
MIDCCRGARLAGTVRDQQPDELGIPSITLFQPWWRLVRPFDQDGFTSAVRRQVRSSV